MKHCCCFFLIKGGVQEKFDLKQLGDLESNFWEILLKSFEKKSLMGCDREVSFELVMRFQLDVRIFLKTCFFYFQPRDTFGQHNITTGRNVLINMLN